MLSLAGGLAAEGHAGITQGDEGRLGHGNLSWAGVGDDCWIESDSLSVTLHVRDDVVRGLSADLARDDPFWDDP